MSIISQALQLVCWTSHVLPHIICYSSSTNSSPTYSSSRLNRASLPPMPPRRLILTLDLPKTKSQIESSHRLISLALNVCDGFSSNYIKLKTDTIARLKKSRDEVKKELQDRWDKWDREEVSCLFFIEKRRESWITCFVSLSRAPGEPIVFFFLGISRSPLSTR